MPRVNWSAEMSSEWDIPRWKRRVRQLRKEFPAPCRVVIRLVEDGVIRDENGDACHAITSSHPNSYEILVTRNVDISISILWLVEEWSHCLAPPTAKKIHHIRWRDVHHTIRFRVLGD